jgi:hypothetical protein
LRVLALNFWKADWVVGRRISQLWGIGLVLLIGACASAESVSPVPTLTLIQVTATSTAVPATPVPTITRPALLDPADIVTPTAQPSAGSVLIPARAQPLVQQTMDDLAARLGVEEDEITLAQLDAAVWTSIDLGCGDTRVPRLANLEVSGYRVLLRVAEQTYEYHTDSRSAIRLCQGTRPIVGWTEEVLAALDPLAVELVGLAQARLARELDLSTRRIRVVAVTAYTWTDSSLGCPQPGRAYVPVTVPGYRIVLMAGDREYAFHSDSTQLMPCASGSEVLPAPAD